MSTRTVEDLLVKAMVDQWRRYWEARYVVGMRLALLDLLEQRKARL